MTIAVRSPASGKVVGEVQETDPETIPDIISRARTAQRQWASLTPRERKTGLQRCQDLLLDRSESIARTVCRETGRPLQEALNVDLMASLAMGRHCIAKVEQLLRPRPVPMAQLSLFMRLLRRRSYLLPQPVGVVGLICPWNYPFALPYTQAAQALATGNAVIIKPSSRAPLSALEIERLARDAGLPPGLVQVVLGHGDHNGERLFDAGLDRMIFTGSEAVGRRVAAAAGSRLTPVTLELGGKDPLIVLPGADLERAAQAAVWASFVNAGQTCGAVKRLLLHEEIKEEFLHLFQVGMGQLKIGDGLEDPDVSMGPLIDSAAVDRIERTVQAALAQGAHLLCGGARAPQGGNYYLPTPLDGVAPEMAVAREEIFGPLVVAMTFQDDAEAAVLANSASMALNASVWGERHRALAVAKQVKAGTAVINNVPYTYGIPTTPWGGPGASGGGRTHGAEGFNFLLELKHVHEDRGSSRDLWWEPCSEQGLRTSRDLTDVLFRGRVGKAFRLLRRR